MTLSALILTKNEEEMIEDCLKQLRFADEIIVLDQNSQDDTEKIAARYASKVISSNSEDFDKNRNLLASNAKSDWLLYVDADERLSENLIQEIKSLILENKFSAYSGPQSAHGRTRTAECSAFYFPRKNIILGKWLKHGGWWPDYVPRLFKKSELENWYGRVHESPKIRGKCGYLKSPLEHLTARSLSLMLKKTTKWAKIEAELFYAAKHPPVTSFKVAAASAMEFLNRYFVKLGLLDGRVGLIEAIYQSLHKAAVMTYLWELQNDATLKFKQISY